MRAILANLIVFLCVMPTYAQNVNNDDPETKLIKLNDTTVLTFKRVSPKIYGIQYPDFFVLETEVTNQQFKVYLDAKKLTKDDTDVLKVIRKRAKTRSFSTADIPYRIEDESTLWRKGAYPKGLQNHPVALVTLHDATNFGNWLNEKNKTGTFRLPTWNEWMVTAYGKSRKYPWGDDWDHTRIHSSHGFKLSFSLDEKSNGKNPPYRTEAVKERKSGKTPEGIYGILGNVGEYIIAGDPTADNYFNLGSRSMGGGFTDIVWSTDDKLHPLPPRHDYWGYSHHSTARKCDLGFRLVLVLENNKTMLKHERLFEQRNKAWMMENAKSSK
ncbi:SUMF1/EgtB/PvdO family nonheme iron enzyme [Gimesia maris]|uniref:SUMF1/EgtB/PvdO family nonheme iron enzyme n=1 Tax=Gimesia maris TaxID=122 RepID=UPI001189A990|nr:SUMF1/EgtB/PvdO family nonheme iron enzyme [Gimesia maris]QDU17434.1 Formylglycine-generating sulfatase enzyme [Gimesia maris]|tara:strand:+ start:122225 stop:123205 length:981 start_codon:yes stop_codon:yes gene_type:complete